MRERFRTALNRKVTMPRWAIFLDFLYRIALLVGAFVVVVLWWQAATRDEEADRNARIQACTSAYAATSTAWDAQLAILDQRSESHDRHAETLLSQIVAAAASDEPITPSVLEEYEQAQAVAETTTGQAKDAARKVRRMTRLRIGLADYAATSVIAGNSFECPALPDDLHVEAEAP